MPVIGGDPALPSPQAPQRAGSSDRRTETGSGEEAQRGLRSGRLCRCQAGAQHASSRTDGSQSECGAKLGRREGGDLDGASPVPTQLRKPLASTNVIESAFSIVEQVCKNVRRWHGGDQRERWVGRSEEQTSELQSLRHLVCRLLLEKKKKRKRSQ